MTVLDAPYRIKNSPSQDAGGVNDGRLEERGRRWSSPPPLFSFDYKNITR